MAGENAATNDGLVDCFGKMVTREKAKEVVQMFCREFPGLVREALTKMERDTRKN